MTRRLDAAHSVILRTGVPECWKETTVGDMAEIIGGGTPAREESAYWRDGIIPWITPTDLTANNAKFISQGSENITELALKESNATLVRRGAIVFSTRGTVGNMAIAALPLTSNQSCEILVPKQEHVQDEFLYYLLHFGMSAFIRLSGGTTFGSITRRDISRVRFAVPTVPAERAAIARILDAVDTAIEHTCSAVDKAEVLVRSLIQSCFEFGLDANGRIRSERGIEHGFTETEIGLLPPGWQVKRLSDLALVERGKFTPRPRNDPRFYNGPYPFLQTGEIARAKGRVVNEFTQSLNEAGKRVSREFPKGTIMITIAANIGETAILGRPMCAPDSLVGAQVYEPNNPRFIELCLRRLRPRLQALAPRSAQANINLTMLRPLRIPVPHDPDEQAGIALLVDAGLDYRDSIATKLIALEQLKKSLMNDLLTGSVRVPAHVATEI